MIESNKVKGYIIKFVFLQAIFKSQMAALKSFVNKINSNYTGQCYEFGTRKIEEFERTWPASFLGTLHKINVYHQCNGGILSEASQKSTS